MWSFERGDKGRKESVYHWCIRSPLICNHGDVAMDMCDSVCDMVSMHVIVLFLNI